MHMNMKLHYQTGTATFIQLAVVVFLIVLNNLVAFIQACTANASNCVVTAFLSMVIIVGAGLWFMALSALGYAAQERRSPRLAKILIGAQLFTAFIALMIVRLPGNWMAGLSAFVTLVVAVWVAVLAYRLSKAKGGRIVQKAQTRRARRRLSERHPTDLK